MTETIMDADFTFAFKRRSSSPSPTECLAPASLHNPSPPPSLTSDVASQDSLGSPRDWAALPWNPSMGMTADNSWMWANLPQQFKPAHTLQSIDPAALSYDFDFQMPPEDSYVPQHHSIPPSLSPLDLLPLLHMSTLPMSVDPPVIHSPPQSSWVPSQDNTVTDQEMVLQAIKAAGVHMAAFQGPSHDASMPTKSPSPPAPKPDLGACPPLAKQLHQGPHSAASSTVASPSPSSNSPQSPQVEPQVILGTSGRPKTSHTTIERRYRTNLNARIMSLRHAVPALRILEKDENQNPRFPQDIVDERGFVDGVKAARKASKASVLGKAAEYIHVLKKREIRLRHEHAGLRLLINSLVGGPAILREFESNWGRRYGGEEMDEVLNASDAEDGDDESDDDDDKPRKKAKVVKAPAPKKEKKLVDPPSDIGKRKRGRPRKVQPGVEDVSPNDSTMEQQPATAPRTASPHTAGVQYMLGAFLFFSFFKPSSDPRHHPDTRYNPHTHSGAVLTGQAKTLFSPPSISTSGISTFVSQYTHIVLWVIFLSSIIFPLLQPLKQFLRTGSSQKNIDLIVKQALTHTSGQDPTQTRQMLRTALDVRGILMELLRSAGRVLGGTASDDGAIVREGWTRLASLELALASDVCRPSAGSLLALYRRTSTRDEMMVLALISWSKSQLVARRLWSAARSLPNGVDIQQSTVDLVLRMTVQEAYTTFVRSNTDFATCDIRTVLSTIANVAVLDAIRGVARDVFVRSVDRFSNNENDADPLDDVDVEEVSTWLQEVVTSVPESSGRILKAWEAIRLGGLEADAVVKEWEPAEGLAGDVQDLLKALALLRQWSPQHSVCRSPLPLTSTQPRNRPHQLPVRILLLQALGTDVFNSDDALEDARDEVVDRLALHRRGILQPVL